MTNNVDMFRSVLLYNKASTDSAYLHWYSLSVDSFLTDSNDSSETVVHQAPVLPTTETCTLAQKILNNNTVFILRNSQRILSFVAKEN